MAVAGALILVLHLWWFRGLTFASFDRTGATVQGLPVRAAGRGADDLHRVMVGVSARALGALPVFAFSTLSAIAALVLDLRLPWTFLLATVHGRHRRAGRLPLRVLLRLPGGRLADGVSRACWCCWRCSRAWA